jgi:hypothetical protein
MYSILYNIVRQFSGGRRRRRRRRRRTVNTLIKRKLTNNIVQNTVHKTEDRANRSPQETE